MTNSSSDNESAQESGVTVRRELSIPNDTEYLSHVRNVVSETVREAGFPRSELNRIVLAVDEAVANIMEHAYEDDLEGALKIDLTVAAGVDYFEIRIRDTGKKFEPQAVEKVEMTDHMKRGRKTGLGVYLMGQIMDRVGYRTLSNGVNELTLIKRAPSAGSGQAGK